MVIFDCNGVLVDSEPLATAIVSQEFMRAGFALTPDIVARYFTGRRPADMFAEVEIAAGRKLPTDFAATVADRDACAASAANCAPTAHVGLRAVLAARAEMRRLLLVARPHPRQPRDHRPDPLLRAQSVFGERRAATASRRRTCSCTPPPRCASARRDCIVVEDSPVGVAAGVAAGMTVIGFVGGSHAGGKLGDHLDAAGARAVISDMRALKSTIVDLRGW